MSRGNQGRAAMAAGLMAAAAARKAANATWKLGSGRSAPSDPTDPENTLREAILWGALSGALVGMTQVLVSRRLSRGERHRNAPLVG